MPRKTDGVLFELQPRPTKGEDGKPLLYAQPVVEYKYNLDDIDDFCNKYRHTSKGEMKRFFGLFCCFFLSALSHAQTIDPRYQDGVLYFQLKSDYPVSSLRIGSGGVVRMADFPMLEPLFAKYGVSQVLRPFHLFGNEALLRTMEVHFDRMDAVDSFVMELQRNEWVALAEKVPLMKVLGTVNDPFYGTLNGRNWKWHLDMIKADSAWMIPYGCI